MAARERDAQQSETHFRLFDHALARLLVRVPQKSWQELGFARGQNVFAQVKSAALGRADVPE